MVTMEDKAKRKAPFGLRIQNDDVKAWVETKAKEEGRSVNNFINRILEQLMKEDLNQHK